MIFKLIVAICKNGGIGIDGKLPWHFKEDLKRFSKLTKGNGKNAIIMGKNTWLSIPTTPLPYRDNLILSTSMSVQTFEHGVCIKSFPNIDEVYDYCQKKDYEEVWVIGGQGVYEQFIKEKKIDELHITYINKTYVCDTFFPKKIKGFTLCKEEESDNNNIKYLTYKKALLDTDHVDGDKLNIY